MICSPHEADTSGQVDARRITILEAAYRLFIRLGYRNVSMKDIAEECRISRPTLYRFFRNKEAIIEGLIEKQFSECLTVTRGLTINSNIPLQARLETFFETWIVAPAAPVIETEVGRDLLFNVALYVPIAVDKHYEQLEAHLVEIIGPDLGDNGSVAADKLAHILILAAKGVKSSSKSLLELRELVSTLIAMAVASAQCKGRSADLD
ncbi:MAG: hypothetical protein ACFWUK_01025 [Serratia liquefaciens]|jgi:AcrR family transcriptional regulator